MRCSKCGFGNQEGSRFCARCGSPMVRQVDVVDGPSCSECGTVNRPGTRYCAQCGAALASARPSRRPQQNGRPRRRWPVVVGVACALVLVAVAVVAAWSPLTMWLATRGSSNVASSRCLLDLEGESLFAQSEDEARAAISSYAETLGVTNIGNQLGSCAISTFEGHTYYRFSQEVDGIPVYGKQAILETGEDGRCSNLNSNCENITIKDDGNQVTVGEARAAASNYAPDAQVISFEGTAMYQSDAMEGYQLCHLFASQGGDTTERLFVSSATGEVLGSEQIELSSSTNASGKTLDNTTNHGKDVSFPVEKVEGAGYYEMRDANRQITVYDGRDSGDCQVYGGIKDKQGNRYYFEEAEDESGRQGQRFRLVLRNGDQERIVGKDEIQDLSTYGGDGIHLAIFDVEQQTRQWLDPVRSTDNTWDSKSVSAMHNVSAAHDYFKNEVSSDLFGSSEGMRVHVVVNARMLRNGNVVQSNAFGMSAYSLDRRYADIVIRFTPDYDEEVDMMGHEYTHGVEGLITGGKDEGQYHFVSGMSSKGETGALKEATSDVFGELIQDYEDDGEMNGSCDWVNDARNLESPGKSTELTHAGWLLLQSSVHPSKYKGWDWCDTSSNVDNGYVHNNSTVISHAVYLMCKGKIDGEALSTHELGKLLFSSFYLLDHDCDFATYAGIVQWKAEKTLSEAKAKRVRAAFKNVDITAATFSAVEMDGKFESKGNGEERVVDERTLEDKRADAPSVVNAPADPYVAIVDQYQKVAAAGWTDEAIDACPDVATRARAIATSFKGGHSAAPNVQYALRDLNGDGKDELLLACDGECVGAPGVKAFVFEILTAPDGVAVAPLLGVSGPGSDKGYGMYGYFPCTDGTVAIRWGKANAEEYFYRIPTDGGPAPLVEGWARLRDANYNDSQHFFYYAIDPSGNQVEMTEDDCNAMRNRHPFISSEDDSSKSALGLRPLSDYKR